MLIIRSSQEDRVLLYIIIQPLSTRLIKPNFCFDLSHRRSTTVSLETRNSIAIYRCSSNGPTFGNGHDIYISNNAASNQNSYTYCDYAYPLPQGILHLVLPADFMQEREATSSLPLILKCFTRQPLRTNRQALLLSDLISALL